MPRVPLMEPAGPVGGRETTTGVTERRRAHRWGVFAADTTLCSPGASPGGQSCRSGESCPGRGARCCPLPGTSGWPSADDALAF